MAEPPPGPDGVVDVIVDTDLGDDIDDTWALAQVFLTPEIRPLLVLTAGHADHDERARIAAKIMNAAGSTGCDIGCGFVQESKRVLMQQRGWATDEDVRQFEARPGGGKVWADGIGRLIELVKANPRPVTLLAIAPLDNIAEALRRDPSIAPKCHFVGMQGCVRRGYAGSTQIVPEYNVRVNPPACAQAFAAPWASAAVTPLDTCGLLQLKGSEYQRVKSCPLPLPSAVMGAYRHWRERIPPADAARRRYGDIEEESTVLFDCVAVHMAHSREYLSFQKLCLRVTESGVTEEAAPGSGPEIDCALEWTDLPGFTRHVLDRLTQPKQQQQQ
eukprot:TRINITY_DN8051_c0_g1_i2.p1 TRINITY_DN8051_c0_g1~~TRINITY_DN8051_c0_g1_i2.p1  ORF type:complete len:356 (+),score=113.26 TRINITY_DN8051_c0_g1_i2:81-1070(+)